MFKIESYIGPLIMGYLNKYIKLDQESFKLSLWGGDAIFHNLELQYDILEDLMPLPIGFKSGQVYELKIHIPWTKLGSESVIITLNTVECILSLKSGYNNRKKSKTRPSNNQEDQLMDKQVQQGYWKSYFNSIINNIHIIVNNLIIKFVEDDIVVSMNAKCLEYFPVVSNWSKGWRSLSSTIYKSVKITDLTICLDQMDAAGHIPIYQEPICYRMSLEARFAVQYPTKMSSNPCFIKFDIHVGDICANISGKQLQLIRRLIELIYALYLGNINWDNVVGCGFSNKKELVNDKIDKLLENNDSNESEEGMDVSSQSWASWAWSYVPAVFSEEIEESDSEEPDTSKFNSTDTKEMKNQHVFVFGLFMDNIKVNLKKQTFTSSLKKISAKSMLKTETILEVDLQKLGLNIVRRQNNFYNCQFGIHEIAVNCLRNCTDCVCGIKKNNKESNLICKFGGSDTNVKVTEKSAHQYADDYLTGSLFQIQSVDGLKSLVNDWIQICRMANSTQDYEQCYPMFNDNSVSHNDGEDKKKLIWSNGFRLDFTYWLVVLQEGLEKELDMDKLFDTDNIRESSLYRMTTSNIELALNPYSLHILLEIIGAIDISQYPSYFKPHATRKISVEIPTEDRVARIHEYVAMRRAMYAISSCTVTIDPYINRHIQSDTNIRLEYSLDRAILTRTQPMYPDKLIGCVSQLPKSLRTTKSSTGSGTSAGSSNTSQLLEYCYNQYDLAVTNTALTFMICDNIDEVNMSEYLKEKTALNVSSVQATWSSLIYPNLWDNSEKAANISRNKITVKDITINLLPQQTKAVILTLLSYRIWLMQCTHNPNTILTENTGKLYNQEIQRLDRINRAILAPNSPLLQACRYVNYRGQTYILITRIPGVSVEWKSGIVTQLYGMSLETNVSMHLENTDNSDNVLMIPVLEAISSESSPPNDSDNNGEGAMCCSVFCILPAKSISEVSTSSKFHCQLKGLSVMLSVHLIKWFSYPTNVSLPIDSLLHNASTASDKTNEDTITQIGSNHSSYLVRSNTGVNQNLSKNPNYLSNKASSCDSVASKLSVPHSHSCQCHCHIDLRPESCSSCHSNVCSYNLTSQKHKFLTQIRPPSLITPNLSLHRQSADGSSHPDQFIDKQSARKHTSRTDSSSIVLPGRAVHYAHNIDMSNNNAISVDIKQPNNSLASVLFNIDLCIKLCKGVNLYCVINPEFSGWKSSEELRSYRMKQYFVGSDRNNCRRLIVNLSLTRLALFNSHRRYYLEDSFLISGNLNSYNQLDLSTSSSSSKLQSKTMATGLPWEFIVHDARIMKNSPIVTATTNDKNKNKNDNNILITPVSLTCSIGASVSNWGMHIDVTEMHLKIPFRRVLQPCIELSGFILDQGKEWYKGVCNSIEILKSILMLNVSQCAHDRIVLSPSTTGNNTFWLQATLALIQIDLIHDHDDVMVDSNLFMLSVQFDDTTFSIDLQQKLAEIKLKLGSFLLKYSNSENEQLTILKSGAWITTIPRTETSADVNVSSFNNSDISKVHTDDRENHKTPQTSTTTSNKKKSHHHSQKPTDEVIRRHCMSLSISLLHKDKTLTRSDIYPSQFSSSFSSNCRSSELSFPSTINTTTTKDQDSLHQNENTTLNSLYTKFQPNLANIQVSCVLQHWECIMNESLIHHTKLMTDRINKSIEPIINSVYNCSTVNSDEPSSIKHKQPLFIAENMPRVYFSMKSASFTLPIYKQVSQYLLLSLSKVTLQPFSDNPIRRPPIPLSSSNDSPPQLSHLLYDNRQFQLTIHGLSVQCVDRNYVMCRSQQDFDTISPRTSFTLHGGQNPAFEWNNSIQNFDISAKDKKENPDNYFILQPVHLQVILSGAIQQPQSNYTLVDLTQPSDNTNPIFVGGYAVEINLITELDLTIPHLSFITNLTDTVQSLLACVSLDTGPVTVSQKNAATSTFTELCVPLDLLLTGRRVSLQLMRLWPCSTTCHEGSLRIHFTQPHLLTTIRQNSVVDKYPHNSQIIKLEAGLFEIGMWRILSNEDNKRTILEVLPGQPDVRTGVLEQFVNVCIETKETELSNDTNKSRYCNWEWIGKIKLARSVKIYLPTFEDLEWLVDLLVYKETERPSNFKTLQQTHKIADRDAIINTSVKWTCNIHLETSSFLVSLPFQLVKKDENEQGSINRYNMRLETGISDINGNMSLIQLSNDCLINSNMKFQSFFIKCSTDTNNMTDQNSQMPSSVMILQPTCMQIQFDYNNYLPIIFLFQFNNMHIIYPHLLIVESLIEFYQHKLTSKTAPTETPLESTPNKRIQSENFITHNDSLRDGSMLLQISDNSTTDDCSSTVPNPGCIRFYDNMMLWTYSGPPRAITQLQIRPIPFVFVDYCGVDTTDPNEDENTDKTTLCVECQLEYWDRVKQIYSPLIGENGQATILLMNESENDSLVIPSNSFVAANSWRLVMGSVASLYSLKTRLPMVKSDKVIVHLSPVLLGAAVCVNTRIQLHSKVIKNPNFNCKFEKFIIEYTHQSKSMNKKSLAHKQTIGNFTLINSPLTQESLLYEDIYNGVEGQQGIQLHIDHFSSLLQTTTDTTTMEFTCSQSHIWANTNPFYQGPRCVIKTNALYTRIHDKKSDLNQRNVTVQIDDGVEVRVEKNRILELLGKKRKCCDIDFVTCGVYVCNLLQSHSLDGNDVWLRNVSGLIGADGDKDTFKWLPLKYGETRIVKLMKTNKDSCIEIGLGNRRKHSLNEKDNVYETVLVPCVYSTNPIGAGVTIKGNNGTGNNNSNKYLLIIQQTITPSIHRVLIYSGDTVLYNKTCHPLFLQFTNTTATQDNPTNLSKESHQKETKHDFKLLPNSLPLSQYLAPNCRNQLEMCVNLNTMPSNDIEYRSSNTQSYLIYPGAKGQPFGNKSVFQFPIKLRAYKTQTNDTNSSGSTNATVQDTENAITILCTVEKLVFETISSTLTERGFFWKVNYNQPASVLLLTFSHPITIHNMLPDPIRVRIWSNQIVKREYTSNDNDQLENSCIESVIIQGFDKLNQTAEKNFNNMIGLLHSPLLTNYHLFIDASIVSDKEQSVLDHPIQLDEKTVIRGLHLKSPLETNSINFHTKDSSYVSTPTNTASINKLLSLLDHKYLIEPKNHHDTSPNPLYTLPLRISPWLFLKNRTIYHLVLAMKTGSSNKQSNKGEQEELFYLEPGSYFLPPFSDKPVKLGVVVSNQVHEDGILWSDALPLSYPTSESTTYLDDIDNSSSSWKYVRVPGEKVTSSHNDNQIIQMSWNLVLVCHYISPTNKNKYDNDEHILSDTYQFYIDCPFTIDNFTDFPLLIKPIFVTPNINVHTELNDFDFVELDHQEKNLRIGKMKLEKGPRIKWLLHIQHEDNNSSGLDSIDARVELLTPTIDGCFMDNQSFDFISNKSANQIYQITCSRSLTILNSSLINIQINKIHCVPVLIVNTLTDDHITIQEMIQSSPGNTDSIVICPPSLQTPYWPDSYKEQLKRKSFVHCLYSVKIKDKHNRNVQQNSLVPDDTFEGSAPDVYEKQVVYTGPLRFKLGVCEKGSNKTSEKLITWSEPFPVQQEDSTETLNLRIGHSKIHLELSVGQATNSCCSILIRVSSSGSSSHNTQLLCNHENLASDLQISFDIQIPQFSIILLDKPPQSITSSQKYQTSKSKLLFNQLDSIRLVLSSNIRIVWHNWNHFSNIELTFKEIRLDNLLAINYGMFDFPTVLHLRNNRGSEYACRIAISNYPCINKSSTECMLQFEMEVKQEICVWVEDAFVYWFISLLSIPSPVPCQCPQSPKIVSTSSLLWKQLTVSPLPLQLTLHAHSTWRHLYVSCADSKLTIPGLVWRQGQCVAVYRRSQYTQSVSEVLCHEIMACVNNNTRFLLLHCAWRLLAGAELLGNPGGLARSLTKALVTLVYGDQEYHQSHKEINKENRYLITAIITRLLTFCRYTSGGVVSSVTGIADSLARNLELCSNWDDDNQLHEPRNLLHNNIGNQGVSVGFLQGLSSFGISVLAGVAGLANQPLQQTIQLSERQGSVAKSEWVHALITGLLRGVAGAVTKPCGGGAAWIAATGRGLLVTIGQTQTLSTTSNHKDSINHIDDGPAMTHQMVIWHHILNSGKPPNNQLILTPTHLYHLFSDSSHPTCQYDLTHFNLVLTTTNKSYDSSDDSFYLLQLVPIKLIDKSGPDQSSQMMNTAANYFLLKSSSTSDNDQLNKIFLDSTAQFLPQKDNNKMMMGDNASIDASPADTNDIINISWTVRESPEIMSQIIKYLKHFSR